uniref:Trypsin inhibitor 1A n=1 Tax=Psophocarpus tetragonolobus TaxID=3891 RepID=IT1A_PSOTE|nr:RecName: Full=Trypsin inhibitor 1A; AltName: Full=WTI-1A [Psophocarpus tetragonolobus]
EPLLDSEGELVRNGGTYYLLPDRWALGGGIEAAATGTETCPLTVVRSPNEVSVGEPLRISSQLRSGFIPDYSVVRIGFANPPKCAPSPWWTVVEDQPQQPSVKLSELKSTKFDYLFKFEKVTSKFSSYKLKYCAKRDTCKDIGIYRDQKGYERLVVTDENPLVVIFKKVESS